MFMLLLLKLSQGVQVMYLDIYVQQSRLNLDNVNKKKNTGNFYGTFLIVINLLVYACFSIHD